MRAGSIIMVGAALGAGAVMSGCGSSGGGAATPTPSRTAAAGLSTAATDRTVTVVGSGTATAKPDIAVVSLGVTMTGMAASDAVGAAKSAGDKLTSTLVAEGVSLDDIATNQYTVSQHFNQNLQRNEGWEVRDGYSAVIRDVTKVGSVIASAAAALPNVFWVNDVHFERATTAGIAGPARDAAMKDARSRAASWAQLAGKQLGDVISVSEEHASTIFTAPNAGMGQGGGGGAFETGTGRLTVTVTVVFAVS